MNVTFVVITSLFCTPVYPLVSCIVQCVSQRNLTQEGFRSEKTPGKTVVCFYKKNLKTLPPLHFRNSTIVRGCLCGEAGWSVVKHSLLLYVQAGWCAWQDFA